PVQTFEFCWCPARTVLEGISMRKFLALIFALGLVMSLASGAALAQEEECVISFLTVWSGEDELPNWEGMVAPFVEETGCRIEVESTRDLVPVLTTRVEAGNPPDIAGVPSFGAIATFLEQGDVVPLDFLDMDRMNEQFGEVWINLGSVDGTLYGIFPRAALKSLIWYSPKAFEAAGYTVPETWDDLLRSEERRVGKECRSGGWAKRERG